MPETNPRTVIDGIAHSTGWTASQIGTAATAYQRAGDIVAVLWIATGDIFAATFHGFYGARLGVLPVGGEQTASVGVICGWLRYSATPLIMPPPPILVLDADDSETADEYDDDVPPSRAGADPGGDPDAARDMDITTRMEVQ